MALLEVRDLSSGYGELQILWNAGLRLESGHLTALIGSNGAGKTTLLRALMGLLRVWHGEVIFDGQNITTLPAHAKAQLGLALVPEGRQLFSNMSVSENLEMGATSRGTRSTIKQDLERVFDIFPRLRERQRQRADTLSGGEQQMLAVARGLMARPRILMLDELSLGLSPVLTLELFQVLRRLKDEGLTILLVEQNVHMALAVSDYAFVLSEGRLTMEGPARELVRNPEVRRAYFGVAGGRVN